MVKAIEKLGLPAVHVCTIIPISQTVGANRIVPAVAIPYPTGNQHWIMRGGIRTPKGNIIEGFKSIRHENI